MKFDPSKYETVKVRKKKFYADYPDGRIIVKPISTSPLEYALFVVVLFKNGEDQAKNLIFATGTALEIRDTEISISSYGKEYESVNYSSWTENCEESAVGRALDNAGYAGNDKCSREEMEKADRMNKRGPKSEPSGAKKSNGHSKTDKKGHSFLFEIQGDHCGDWIILKGKYEGKKLSDIAKGTLSWYADNMDGEWQKVANQELERRSVGEEKAKISDADQLEMNTKIRKAWNFLGYSADDIKEDVKAFLDLDSPMELKKCSKKELDGYHNHLRCRQIKVDIRKGWHTLEYEDTHKENSLMKNAFIPSMKEFEKCEDYEVLENYYQYLLER